MTTTPRTRGMRPPSEDLPRPSVRPAWRVALRSPAGVIGAALLGVMLVVCTVSAPWTFTSAAPDQPARYHAGSLDAALFPPAFAPMREGERARLDALPDEQRPPMLARLMGTDALGRSVLYRCLAGGVISIGIGLAAATISVVIGTLYGTLAALAGGRTDALLMRIVDVLYGLPYLLLVVLLAVAGDTLIEQLAQSGALGAGGDVSAPVRSALGVVILLIAIGGVSWLTMARVIRGQVLSLKQMPFIEAARATGVPTARLVRRHLLPNLVGPIVVYATLTVPQAILQESFLSFLGIGVQPPLPSWGNLAADGLVELNPFRVRWWLLAFPCLMLGLTLVGLNLLGESLREAFDPRARVQ